MGENLLNFCYLEFFENTTISYTLVSDNKSHITT